MQKEPLYRYETGQDGGKLRVMAITPEIIRITYTKKDSFSKAPSLMLVQDDKAPVCMEMIENEADVILLTGRVTVVINRRTLACKYYDGNGFLLMSENQRRPRELEEVEVYRCVHGDETTISQRTTVDGVRVDARSLKRVFDRMAFHTKLNLDFLDGEAVMGFGSHEEGYLNLRGKSRFLYQQNMKACIPFFWSTRGYGMLFDSYTDMTFHDDGYGSYLWTDVDEEMDYYFVAGGSFDRVIAGYRRLTGKAPMPPRWSFGFCQSKERYTSAEELLEVAGEYRRRGIPLDLMILDWKSWEGELWGEKIFDRTRFPDPSEMMERLHGDNVKLMISIWPHMAPGGKNHREFSENGLLLLNNSTYNPFGKAGREMYWRQAEEGLFRHGIDAWWCDCTEPFEADWTESPVKPEPEQRQRMNVKETSTYIDPEYVCAYSLLHCRGIYEGQRRASEKRVLNLTRSSYAGQQRYGAFTWSGDISANWTTLRKQIAEGLSFTSSGCPYWTLDIGGFFVRDWKQWYGDGHYDKGPEDDEYRELFVRWFQYGAFLPMFRVHGTDFPREIWRFGEKGEPVYDTLVKFIRLRYRLLPYLYSLAHRVTKDDYTFMRPVAADFPKDEKAAGVDDQFMFGPWLMICPVYEKGAHSRKVYLPEDEKWYDFWTGMPVVAGNLPVEAPLDRIPVFVRAGAILPMGPVVQHTGEKVAVPLELHIFPGKSSSFILYDDDGETYAYERGAYSERVLHWNDASGELLAEGGTFEGGIYGSSTFKIIIKGK